MDNRSSLTIIFLATCAVGSWQLGNHHSNNKIIIETNEPNSKGFYLQNAKILGTGENGKLLYQIKAQRAQQLPNQSIELKNVSLRYSSNTGIPWIINAKTAIISKDQKNLDLSGEVVATSQVGFSGKTTEIKTPLLRIEPMNYKAETNSSVYLKIGPQQILATGMLALLKENRLELKSDVNGMFNP